MAKIGPKEKGGYDPFSAISESLTALQEPPAEPAEAEETEREERSEAAEAVETPKRRPVMPAPAKPVVVQPEQREPEAPADDESSGGAIEQPIRQAPRPKTVSASSALQITKRFKTTRQEAAEVETAAVRLGAALGVSVDFSKLTRALWDVYMRHQEDILRNVPDDAAWERPANNDAAGLAELDERLADLINDGLMIACRRPKNVR